MNRTELEKCAIIILLIFLCTFCADIRPANAENTAQGRIVETADYLLYIPKALDPQKKYPLIVALHPGADAGCMIDLWKRNADRHHWIIFASKKFSNGQDIEESLADLVSILKNRIISKYPIDTGRIAAGGFSGGGMGSHGLAFEYPDLISAVIVNTCMINKYYHTVAERYPERKKAVFLASPTDFRYNEMKSDRALLEQHGWKTKWIEFEGGHRFAPAQCYDAAADWLEDQWKK
ncbi:MAG: hypothetical protein AB2L14_06665 [Candidatus Xenobiia bacterium LiM19]